jgi:hypothetical protein
MEGQRSSKRKIVAFLIYCGWMAFMLSGCGNGLASSSGSNPGSGSTGANSAPVSLSMTDDPPSGVTVLLFQIGLTAASLSPASGSGAVSLLNSSTPIQINVTQLQTLSALLGMANVPAGTYNSLNLTFTNPQLVILNTSDQSLASTCPLNTICNLSPQLDNSSSVSVTSSPFPVTAEQNAPLGLLVDFHLNNVIQNDLSVNLGVANGVTVSQLAASSPSSPAGPPAFGFLSGTVQSVDSSQNQFTLQSGFGGTFTVGVNGSTTYQGFPSSFCSTNGFSCIAPGQNVQVQVTGVEPGGTVLASEVSYSQLAGQQLLVGDILSVNSANGSTVIELLLHSSPSGSSLPLLGYVTVTGPADFSIDAGSFSIPSGLSFGGTSDLVFGQEVTVDVVSGTLSSPTTSGSGLSSVSFTTDRVTLEPGQLSNNITSVDSSDSSFTIVGPSYCTPSGCTTAAQVTTETTVQTTYQGLTPDSFSGLAVNGVVSVQGWLFSTPSGATPSTMVAQTVIGRSADGF